MNNTVFISFPVLSLKQNLPFSAGSNTVVSELGLHKDFKA